jgi:hypothetical protein
VTCFAKSCRGNGKDVCIGGGVATVQQYIRAGLIMNRALSVAAVFLGIASVALNRISAQDGEVASGAPRNQEPVVVTPRENQERDGSARPVRDRRSLKDAAGDRFKMGVGIGQRALDQPDDASLIRQHFQILTPENREKDKGKGHATQTRVNLFPRRPARTETRRSRIKRTNHCTRFKPESEALRVSTRLHSEPSDLWSRSVVR